MAPTALNIHVNASSDSGVVSARTETLSEQSTIEVPYVSQLTVEIALSAGLLPITLISCTHTTAQALMAISLSYQMMQHCYSIAGAFC